MPVGEKDKVVKEGAQTPAAEAEKGVVNAVENPLIEEYEDKSVDEILREIRRFLDEGEKKGYVRLDDLIRVYTAAEALKLRTKDVSLLSVNLEDLSRRITDFDVLLVDVEEDKLLNAIKFYSSYTEKFRQILDYLRLGANDPFVVSTLKGDVLLSQLKSVVEKSRNLERVGQISQELESLKDEVRNLKDSFAKEIETIKDDFLIDFTGKVNSIKQAMKENLKGVAQKLVEVNEERIKEEVSRLREEFEARLKEIENKVSSVESGEEDEVEKELEEVKSQISALRSKVEELASVSSLSFSENNLRALVHEIVVDVLSKNVPQLSGPPPSLEEISESVLEKAKESGDEEEETAKEEEREEEEPAKEDVSQGSDRILYVNAFLIAFNALLLIIKML